MQSVQLRSYSTPHQRRQAFSSAGAEPLELRGRVYGRICSPYTVTISSGPAVRIELSRRHTIRFIERADRSWCQHTSCPCEHRNRPTGQRRQGGRHRNLLYDWLSLHDGGSRREVLQNQAAPSAQCSTLRGSSFILALLTPSARVSSTDGPQATQDHATD